MNIIHLHWFRWWLGTEQAISQYLNQWWPSSVTTWWHHKLTYWSLVLFCHVRFCIDSLVILWNGIPVTYYGKLKTWLSLVQVMACHLFSAKQLPEPLQMYENIDINVTVGGETNYDDPQWLLVWSVRNSILMPEWKNGLNFADCIFKLFFMDENVWNFMENELRFIYKGP